MRHLKSSRSITPSVALLLGLIALLALLALGLLARTAEVTHQDLRIDEVAQRIRFPLATGVFVVLTDAASEIAGIAALMAGAVALIARRRRWDAVRLVAMAGAGWTIALGVKTVIARPRPPASLWAITPDASGSFPSGHDTTACVVILVALLAFSGTGRARMWATGAAVVFAAAVGASRVYLGDHYPTDVVGSWLAVAAGALLVWGAGELTPVREAAGRLLRDRHLRAVVEAR